MVVQPLGVGKRLNYQVMAMPISKPAKRIHPLVLSSPAAMQGWGKQLARILKPGDTLALIGELGSGKTTLVQGIASGWGYTRRANSPTFALVNEYQGTRGRLYHMDMYRLSKNELEAFPLEEYLGEKAIFLIEWADRVRSRWPAETLAIELSMPHPETRQLEILTPSPSWMKRLSALKNE
jgi:tRNA threonylcarbamoyladenosine biosynthesis protein TsaE